MFGSISTRIAAYVAGALALALAVFLIFAWIGEGEAKRQNKQLRTDLVTTNQAWGECKANLSQARGEIDVQNAAIQKMEADAAAAQRAADARVAKAQAEARQYRDRATRLAAAKPQGADRCAAASALYVDVISEDLK